MTANNQCSVSATATPTISVTLGGQQDVAFEELSALNVEAQVLEYRHGNSPVFYPIKMPGLGRVGNVALRQVVLTDSSGFSEWQAAYESGLIKPFQVVIRVFDEAGDAALSWTLKQAWPTKIVGVEPLETAQATVKVRLLELACEAITVTAAPA